MDLILKRAKRRQRVSVNVPQREKDQLAIADFEWKEPAQGCR